MEDENHEWRELLAFERAAFEQHRKRIAAKLHDNVCQGLTLLTMELAQWQETTNTDTTEAERIGKLLELLGDVNKAVRDVSSDLHPRIIDEFGLVAGFQFECRRLQASSPVELHCSVNLPDLDCPKPVATEIFRLFQGMAALGLKSPGATGASIKVEAQKKVLRISIVTDGEFAVSAESLAWKSLQERTRWVGGDLSVANNASDSALVFEVPIEGHRIKTPQGDA